MSARTIACVERRFPFLSARWLNLILINYRVDPAVLLPLLPPGCGLDLVEGHAFASLVAFDFVDTRVLGIRWPGFVHFPEINLRFYVRYPDVDGVQRGVCFVREFVPLKTVARLARWIYNEPYAVARMRSDVLRAPGTITVRHELGFEGSMNSVEVIAGDQGSCPPTDSRECFFKEHEWGFGTSRSGRLVRYQVIHPAWDIYPVKSCKLTWDWEAVYGARWNFLQHADPESVILAAGSGVSVFPHSTPLIG